jgi:hypothetical protein
MGGLVGFIGDKRFHGDVVWFRGAHRRRTKKCDNRLSATPDSESLKERRIWKFEVNGTLNVGLGLRQRPQRMGLCHHCAVYRKEEGSELPVHIRMPPEARYTLSHYEIVTRAHCKPSPKLIRGPPLTTPPEAYKFSAY